MIKIGVLSDTHDHLDPAVPELFEGVDHIFHAGDIGLPWLLLKLEDVAPVTAVAGNTDVGLAYNETEVLELDGRKFLIHHTVEINNLPDKLRRRIIRENPDVVIFGHTHRRFCSTVDQTLYFNPGYAGKPKGDTERSVAILTCDDSGITAEYLAF